MGIEGLGVPDSWEEPDLSGSPERPVFGEPSLSDTLASGRDYRHDIDPDSSLNYQPDIDTRLWSDEPASELDPWNNLDGPSLPDEPASGQDSTGPHIDTRSPLDPGRTDGSDRKRLLTPPHGKLPQHEPLPLRPEDLTAAKKTGNLSDSAKVSPTPESVDRRFDSGSFRCEDDTVSYRSPDRFFPDPEKVIDAIKDEGEEAFAEFMASKIESAILDRVWESWPANEEVALANDAQYLAGWDASLHEEIGRLTTELLSDGNIPGAVLAGSIAQLIPIDCLDKSLGDIGLIIEIAGVVVCILSGNPLLGSACVKALLHDLAHRMLVAAIKDEIKYLLAGDHSGNPASDKSVAPAEPMARGTHRPAELRTGIQPDRPAGTTPTVYVAWHAQGTSTSRQSKSTWTNPRAGTSTLAKPTIKAGSGKAAPVALTGAVGPIKSPVRTDTPPESRRSAAQEGQTIPAEDTFESGYTKLAQPAAIGQPAIGQTEKLTFVRLRVHYELLDPPVPVADSTRPSRLIRLIVIRESTPVLLPESSNIIDDTGKRNANGQTDYVAQQLGRVGKLNVLQLWRTAGDDALTLDPVSVAALEANLGCIFIGLPANLDGTGLIGQGISVDTALHLLGPSTRCVEVMGFIAEKSGRPIVQCIGSKAAVHDEFCAIVLAEINPRRRS